MSVCQVAISLLLGGRCLLVANFSELRYTEVQLRSISLPRTPVNRDSLIGVTPARLQFGARL
jgi:hypothetical protein